MAADANDAEGLHGRLATNCLKLGDYDCAVAETLQVFPHLDASDGRAPGIVTLGDFRAAVHLVHALRRSGDRDAAARLLLAASRWYDERANHGEMRLEGYFAAELLLLRGEEDAALADIRARIMRDGSAFIAQRPGAGFDLSIYDPLRDNPEFIALVAEYDRRRAAAAAEVRRLIADADF